MVSGISPGPCRRLERWVGEKRDIRADFQSLFGEEIDRIGAVALMTDTNNSGQSVTAWYGDHCFTAR